MSGLLQDDSLDALLDEVFGSTPLLFVRDFLRQQRKRAKQVRIGDTRKEVRANLRDAIVSKKIGREELQEWLHAVGGWGKQHLYLGSVGKRARTFAHLLNTPQLRRFLKAKGFLTELAGDEEPPSAHVLRQVVVDDEVARITWHSHALDYERRKELDQVRELDDGEYEFRAHRRIPRRSACRFIVRKLDGIILTLIDLPLGEEHDAVRTRMQEVAEAVLSPYVPTPMPLAPIVSGLDQGAVAEYGPKPKRSLDLGVEPTQARYRTDGAQVEFKSTRASSLYAESDPVRRVRKAMQIEKFEGEAGKFRLTFEGEHQQAHRMIVSIHAFDNRIFLYSRMNETEVLALVDQLLSVGA